MKPTLSVSRELSVVERYLQMARSDQSGNLQALDQLWEGMTLDEKALLGSRLNEDLHARNARHAEAILRGLPQRWRDDVVRRLKQASAA